MGMVPFSVLSRPSTKVLQSPSSPPTAISKHAHHPGEPGSSFPQQNSIQVSIADGTSRSAAPHTITSYFYLHHLPPPIYLRSPLSMPCNAMPCILPSTIKTSTNLFAPTARPPAAEQNSRLPAAASRGSRYQRRGAVVAPPLLFTLRGPGAGTTPRWTPRVSSHAHGDRRSSRTANHACVIGLVQHLLHCFFFIL